MAPIPKNTPDVPLTSQRMANLVLQRDLTLDDIQNEEWLVRLMTQVQQDTVLVVDARLMQELNAIMVEAATAYQADGAFRLPVVREITDLEILEEQQSRCTGLLSRVAQVTITLYGIRKRIEEFWDLCEEKINRYPVVAKELTNDRKRTLFYRAALKPLRERQSNLELAFETAKKIEEHLESVHYAIKEVSAMGRDYLGKSMRPDRNEMR